MIQGVLFDMDGVLVDSERFINQAAINMFKEKGLDVKPSDFNDFVGKGENRYIGGVAELYDFPLNLDEAKARTYQIYEELAKSQLTPLPGVFSFIQKCRDKGLKIAVATSADEVKMNINLDSIGLSENDFDATVNGLEVEHKKPAPDIFIEAARKIDLSPQNCLVVEDAISGVQAAKEAGAKCLALLGSFSENELAQADWIAKDLADAPEEVLNW